MWQGDLVSPRDLRPEDFELIVRRIADDVLFGSDPSRFVGSGLEYASSRPYAPGDSVRAIHWRLTARHGQAFVKEHEVLRRLPTYLVVDTSASMIASSRPTSKLDLATWLAALIGLVAIRRLSPVALVGYARDSSGARPSLRRADLWLALVPLRQLHPPGARSVSSALREVELVAPSTSTIVVISDFYEPAAVESVVRCAQRHECIALRLVDPAERQALRAGFFRGQEAESGQSFVGSSRTKWVDEVDGDDALLGAGVDVFTLGTDVPPAPALRRFFGARGPRTRRCR